MKFTDFTTKEIFEHSALKLALLLLSVTNIVFFIMLVMDFAKDPVVIDRSCESTLLEVSSAKQTKQEIEVFLKTAISLRFDSTVTQDPSSYMIQDIYLNRTKEQEELKKSNVDQKMIVRNIEGKAGYFTINADRVVAVGKARSAIPIILEAKVSSKDRSVSNPYGLTLTSIEQKKEVGINDK